MKVMIMAGGTGGHVYPALAIADALRKQGHEVVWMGAPDSFESRTVPGHGIAIEFIRVSGLRGKGIAKLFQAPLLLIRALRDAIAVLRRQQPQLVLGMGGFAAGPGGVAAWLTRRPLLIHEQNAAAGMTNRLLARIASRVLEAFPHTFSKALTVGNPVRAGFAELPAPSQRLAREGAMRVLVVGGSQGAKALNTLVPKALSLLPEAARPQVRHQAGRTLETAQQCYAESGVAASIEAFIDDMPAAYAWADLVVCRAGASTIAELAAAGCAALLVPFPAAVDDHQTRNGEYLVAAGAAQLVQERDLNPELLSALLSALLSDRAALAQMGEAARRAAWTDATERIVAECLAQGSARA
ncbi:undecaprenyldiphospho-muramoylpentapeptide beta-N-acetylglucosaminyltransferase [Solimonas sp. K1W22B-7]|uniref:undecaprenyldiphospho-muramoylpentapeptide beta-N-acetylglucosaminyltransferase n=1 Tax=Solimonas sp. K1W22B-7 TaxID=2303331 RepID=UPI000E32E338|nr:undecaprenyldiphospho-muramoylpentapeptide beta-N-acetylglucosaminyltransferase [Solimonas sp. K1W22B-7]AXQ28081.1 undecaprenyldiphospho-muramoylpentapeptide beta-N-acetylglucosaminyltransferase [Solimonas sp. K1W22B-7]